MALKRIKKEFTDLPKDLPTNCSVSLFGDQDFYKWKAKILGLEGSLYQGGRFNLIPMDYPFRPPKILFLTLIYHPNINSHEQLSLDLLKDQWSPALKISKILSVICEVLENPNPDDPLDPEIAKIYKSNKQLFAQNVQQSIQACKLIFDSQREKQLNIISSVILISFLFLIIRKYQCKKNCNFSLFLISCVYFLRRFKLSHIFNIDTIPIHLNQLKFLPDFIHIYTQIYNKNQENILREFLNYINIH